MTVVDDYRNFLKAKLLSAESILKDAEDRKESGEITKSNYLSMWRREIKRINGELEKELFDPATFFDDADIWRRRELMINIPFEAFRKNHPELYEG